MSFLFAAELRSEHRPDDLRAQELRAVHDRIDRIVAPALRSPAASSSPAKPLTSAPLRGLSFEERFGSLLRRVGLLTALAASVIIVASVWLLQGPSKATDARGGGQVSNPTQMVAMRAAAQWERVALNLRVDPPAMATDNGAAQYARTVNWMLDGLARR
jgi:hypothetical protein